MAIPVGALSLIQTIGSVFVKSNESGKAEVAVAPWMVLYVAGSMFGCYNQTGEPFSVCVKTMFSVFGG